MLLKKIGAYLEMIKIWHSLFALPFAIIGALYSCQKELGWLQAGRKWEKMILIILAMVCVRSCAMAFNRICDLRYDALNPRTANRALVLRLISVNSTWIFVFACSLLFVFICFNLNELAFYLSPLALFIVLIYSWTKRWTYLSHYILGVSLSLAPAGGWIGMAGEIDFVFVPLMLAVMFWVGGFDIIYALLDIDFDKKTGLKSIPAKFGREKSLRISRISHIMMVVSLLAFGVVQKVSFIFFCGVFFIGMLLLYEHKLAEKSDEQAINKAFFGVNAVISSFLLIIVFADLFL